MKTNKQFASDEIFGNNSKKNKPNKFRSSSRGEKHYFTGSGLITDQNNKPIKIGDIIQTRKGTNHLVECEVLEIGTGDMLTVCHDDYREALIETFKVHASEVSVLEL